MEPNNVLTQAAESSLSNQFAEVSSAPVKAPRTAQQQIWTWLLFVGLTTLLSILVGSLRGEIFTMDDADAYLQMANGESHLVPQPYTSRQLGPLIVHATSQLLHASIYSAYVIEGVFSIIIVVGVVGFLLVRSHANAFALIAVGGLSFWASLYNGLVLPDLLFAGLLGIFLYFLYRKHYLVAALMLLPLTVARESTVLVLFCLLVVGWKRLSRVDIVVALAASFGGMAIVKALVAGGLGNQDRLGSFAYMGGKVVWNLLRNVFGLNIWNNVATNNVCSVPSWQMQVHLGGIREIGMCAYEPTLTLCTFRTALACFGLLPILCFYLWRKHLLRVSPANILIRFILLYGTICFLLAPALGPSLPRLFGYSWPIFAIATPVLAQRLKLSRIQALSFLFLHLAIAWVMWSIGFKRQSVFVESALLLVIVISYIAGWYLLSHVEQAGPDESLLA